MNLAEISQMYFPQYQADSVSPSALRAWREIAAVLVHHCPECVTWLDIGCGGGGLLSALETQHRRVLGVEGSVHALGLLPVPIVTWDLREPLRLPYRFDAVCCFDVGEHVGNAEVLAETCARNCANTIFFGAAPPGQDGLGHIDCRPYTDWHELFRTHGFTLRPTHTERIKADIQGREGTNFLWWIEKNLHVYQRVKA